MLNSLVQSTQPSGANPMNINGMDLPGAAPPPGGPGAPGMGGMNQPGPGGQPLSNQNMGGGGPQGNMLPPAWPPQNQPGMAGGQISQTGPGGGPMPPQQPNKPLGGPASNGPLPGGVPPNMMSNHQQPGGPAQQPGMPTIGGGGGSAQGGNIPISAPEMKKAYDALGLTYPGSGGMGPQQNMAPHAGTYRIWLLDRERKNYMSVCVFENERRLSSCCKQEQREFLFSSCCYRLG